MTVIRAEIVSPPQRESFYQVDNVTAATLSGLCVKLLAAGFDPEASVECYRPGREAWDIRAKSIRAAAGLRPSPHGVGFVRCTGSPPMREDPSGLGDTASPPNAHPGPPSHCAPNTAASEGGGA
jgi:hypothetical protein